MILFYEKLTSIIYFILSNKYLRIALISLFAFISIYLFCKSIYNSGYKEGVKNERLLQDIAVKERLKKQEEELKVFYSELIEIEKNDKKIEYIYIQGKSKLSELKKNDKSAGISKEQAQSLNEIFKDLK